MKDDIFDPSALRSRWETPEASPAERERHDPPGRSPARERLALLKQLLPDHLGGGAKVVEPIVGAIERLLTELLPAEGEPQPPAEGVEEKTAQLLGWIDRLEDAADALLMRRRLDSGALREPAPRKA